jgi:hypothetical protein
MQYIYSQFHQKLKREEPLWHSIIGVIMVGALMVLLPFLLAAFQ